MLIVTGEISALLSFPSCHPVPFPMPAFLGRISHLDSMDLKLLRMKQLSLFGLEYLYLYKDVLHCLKHAVTKYNRWEHFFKLMN